MADKEAQMEANNIGEENNKSNIVLDKEAKMEANNEKENNKGKSDVPLMALNHISRLCTSVEKSIDFYKNVLGFVLTKRPSSLDVDGAWLFNYGVGIHLVQAKDCGGDKLCENKEEDHLDPANNHISFQCEDMEMMEQKLKDMNIEYIKRTLGEEEDDSAKIDQLFFNDPDGFMIEMCNCENLKLVPQRSIGKIKLPFDRHYPPVEILQD